MSNRATLIFGGLLILFIAIQAGLLLHGRSESVGASLEVRATSAGIPLAPGDAQIFVYRQENPDDLVAKGKLAEALALPAGRYDVRVLYGLTRDQVTLRLPDVALRDGEQRVERVDFPVGEVSVEASVGSAPAEEGEVVVTLFAPEDHDRIITTMGAGERIRLGAGTYDLRVVWSRDSEEKDVAWLRGVEVRAGLHGIESLAFDRGLLLVRATNGGEALPADAVALTVYRAGDADRSVVERGFAGGPLGLAAGTYDVKATFEASNDADVRWLTGIEIESGVLLERSVAFSSGTLLVTAALEGGGPLEDFQVYVYTYRAGDHEAPVAYAPAGQPVVLASGAYDLRAHFFRSHDRPDIWLRDLAIEAGDTVRREIAFPSGRLLVRAYDDKGEEIIGDNVVVVVHAPGERAHPIARARAGEILTLREGAYDLRAWDTRRPACETWLENIQLRTGALLERAVTFPPALTPACVARREP